MTARLELVWPGKDKFLLAPKDESGKPVWVERDHTTTSRVRLTDFTRPRSAAGGNHCQSDPFRPSGTGNGPDLDGVDLLPVAEGRLLAPRASRAVEAAARFEANKRPLADPAAGWLGCSGESSDA